MMKACLSAATLQTVINYEKNCTFHMNVRKILTFAVKGLTVVIFFVLSAECGTLQRQKKIL